MNPYYLLAPVLLPVMTGAAVLGLRPKERRKREMLVMGGILAASAVIGALVVNGPKQPLVLYRFGGRMNISLGLDGLSGVFACLIAVLWPLTTLYSFEYMKHEGKENKFFGYFSITYGVVAGVALSHSLITLSLTAKIRPQINSTPRGCRHMRARRRARKTASGMPAAQSRM